MQLFEVFASIGVKADEFNKEIDKAEKKGKDFADNFGKKMTAFGKSLLPVTAAIMGIATAAFASATTVENAFSIIRASSGATGKELDSLKDSFKNVFKNVPESAEIVADVLSKLNTSTGLYGDKLEELTDLTLKYARVNKMDAGDSADVLGRLMNGLDMTTSELITTMDQLTAASQMSGIGVNDLAEYIISAGPAFEEMGFNVERSIALFSSFYKAGAEPREVLSSLNIVLNKMAQDGSTNAEQAFTDLLESIKDAPDILSATLIASEAFGSRVGAKVADDIRAGRFEVDEWVDALRDAEGTLEQTAAETIKFADKLNIFKNQATLAFEPLGATLITLLSNALKAAEPFIAALSRLAENFAALDSGTQTTIIAVAAFLALLGPGLMLLGKMVTSISAKVTAFKALSLAATGAVSASKAEALATTAATKATLAHNAALRAAEARRLADTLAAKVAAGAKGLEAKARAANTQAVALESVATKAATLAKTAEAAANVTSTATLSAKTVLVGLITGKIGLATAAQWLWNAAMLANPIGLIIAGVAALAAGIAFLVIKMRKKSEEAQRLADDTKRLREETDALNDSVRDSANAHESKASSIEAEIGANRNLLSTLKELIAADDGSATSRQRVAAQVAILNESMSDLNLQYDTETGLLNQTIDSIEALIETRAEQARAAAAQARAVEIAREQIIVEEQRTRVLNRMKEAEEAGLHVVERRVRGHHGQLMTITESSEAYLDLTKQLEELEAQNKELEQSFEYVSQVIVDTTRVVENSTDTIVDSLEEQKTAFDEAKEKYGQFSREAREAFEAAVDSGEIWCERTIELYRAASDHAEDHRQKVATAMDGLGAEYERVRDRASDAFGVMSEKVSVSMKQATENILENTRLITEQAENTATAMTRAMEMGVDEGVLRKLEEMADKGPGYAAMLANASDAEFKQLIDAWDASAKASVDAVATRFGTDQSVVAEAASLADSATQSLRQQLDAANIENMGSNIASALAAGITSNTLQAAETAKRMGMSIDEYARLALGIASPSKTFTKYGENLPTSVGRGITLQTRNATSASTNMSQQTVEAAGRILTPNALVAMTTAMIQGLINTINNMSATAGSAATNMGNNVVNSLANAIRNGQSTVANAMITMVQAAINAANAALGIKSPSKVFTEMGDNVIHSFADTVLKNKGLIERTIDDVFGDLDRDVTIGFGSGGSMIPAMAFAGGEGGEIRDLHIHMESTVQTPYEAAQQMVAGLRRERWARKPRNK